MKTTFAFLFGLLAAPQSDWTRWRGPEGTGISAEADWKPQALMPAPKIAWRTPLGEGHSSVAVAGKRLYTMGNQKGRDIVYCLDAETGKDVWRYAYGCNAGNYPGPRSSPVLDGGLVYTLSRDGDALCLEAETGKLKWQVDLKKTYSIVNLAWGLAGAPLVTGDLVIYNARSHGIALNKATGQKVWVSGGGEGGYAAPVPFKLKDVDCLAMFGFAELSVVDLATGKKRHSFPWLTQYNVNAADPVAFDGKLFISSGYDRGCALLDLSGNGVRSLWENKNLSSHFASPIYLDGHLYGVDGNTSNGRLRCLDAKTGQVKWTQTGNFENLMVAAGKILAIDKRGVLTIVEASPAAYREIARATVLSARAQNWTAPVLANGRIYCRNSDGDLVCVDVR